MICSLKDIAIRALTSQNRTRMVFPGKGPIQDMVRFGFSFVESEDDMVSYIIAHPSRMKDILCGFSEAELNPENGALGRLWTAELICVRKMKGNQIVFANQSMGVVLVLDIQNNK